MANNGDRFGQLAQNIRSRFNFSGGSGDLFSKGLKRVNKAASKGWSDYTGKTAAAKAERTAYKQMEEQERYARHGIQWRVEDATKAGIHPLYAIGAQTPSYSPVSMDMPATSDVRSLLDLGQGLSSFSKLTSSREREIQSLQLRAAQLDVQDKELDVRRKASELALFNSPGRPPSYDPGSTSSQPIAGQSSVNGLISEKPMERSPSYPGSPHQEPGSKVFQGFARTSTGWMPIPSKDIKESIEDQVVPELVTGARMYFGPNFKPDPPAGVQVPRGHKLVWNPVMFEYQLKKLDTFDRQKDNWKKLYNLMK